MLLFSCCSSERLRSEAKNAHVGILADAGAFCSLAAG